MREQLREISESFKAKLNQAADLDILEDLRVSFLGKKGQLTSVLRGMGQLSAEEREVYDSINRMLDSDLDQSFNQLLLSMIDEAGIDDVACYKRANIDRRLFSKIRSDPSYHPRKSTVLAFAIALKLEVRRISTLLMKAGCALADADPRDLIIVFFAKQGNYDIDRINSALLAVDLEPLC